ncbi:malate synthase [Shewanella sp. HN-41]|uniref:malate synthase n=1 Tax=Shewanella sp. HN-41 TaxID=327275 RepID=UPI0002125776|nr:malate synthase [Shewanella sp. HN-41]EGM71904.1 putative malate synthase protein [Shewanella sp. HN-41]
MNMPMIKSNQIQPNLNSLIAEEVLAVAQVNVAEHEKIAKAKQFLDRAFPLNSGSHQDVSSYVVYYQHLLAFFADGSHSGLRQPKQFVAFNGTKDSPNAIVLQDQGCHVELSFDRSGMIGTRDLANLEDVQIEAPTSIETTEARSSTSRHWLSLLHAGMPSANDTQDKQFTAKDGGDYSLKTIVNL